MGANERDQFTSSKWAAVFGPFVTTLPRSIDFVIVSYHVISLQISLPKTHRGQGCCWSSLEQGVIKRRIGCTSCAVRDRNS